MPDFHLAFTLKTVVLIAAPALSFLLAFWFYRFAVPPISKPLKTVLLSLRALSILLIFLLLGEPLLSLLSHTVEKPIVEVLIDNSRSMSIRDRAGDRKVILGKTLSSPAMSDLRSAGVTEYSLFDITSRTLSSFAVDSLTVNRDGTDIGAALRRLKDAATKRNIQAAVLITDGQFTAGTNPLYEAQDLGLPVYTVGVGDSTEQKDLQVRRVLANEITYLGSRVPVNATVRSTGFDGEKVEVTLQQAGVILDRKVLVLEQGTREYAVPLSFVPAQEGTQKFTVSVSRLPGELTENNNSLSFFTKVLKSKMKVLVLAGSPSQDFAFIRRTMEGDKNVDLKCLVEEKGGDFYGGPLVAQLVGDADCLLLIDFPNSSTSASSLEMVHDALAGSKPFLFVLSRTEDFRMLRTLEASLPFTTGEVNSNEYQVFVSIPDAEADNPILKPASGSVDAWSKLAPVFRVQGEFTAKPEAEILGTARIQSTTVRDPVLISRNVNHKKSMAILAYGIWRWKMYGDPASGTENLLDEFLSNAVRWLTTREDDRRFRVQPAKTIFGGQDPVEFTGQLYDATYKPIDDAMVQVTITHGKESNDLILNSAGNGQYDGSLDRLSQGDYAYTAKAQQNGKTVGEDKGTFSVGGLNIEFLDTRMNKLLLQQIAARTGGKYYDTDNLSSLSKDIDSLPNFKPRELTRSSDVELWNFKWTLSFIILLLSVEWFLRKRNGLI